MDGEDRPHGDGCPGVWRLVGAVLDQDVGESATTYVCELCGDLLLVGPGEVHPQTV